MCNKLLFVLVIVVLALFMIGCQEYAAGVGTGVGVMETLVGDIREAEEGLVSGINLLKAETVRVNALISEVKGTVVVRPETLEELRDAKDMAGSPTTWIALASIIANSVLGTRAYDKRIMNAPSS